MNNQPDEFIQVLDTESSHRVVTLDLHSIKLDYLYSQKQKLQVQLSQMTLNNELLRKINYDIAKQNNIDIESLIRRNSELESMLEKMFNQNKQMRANIFLNAQVNLQTQRQQKDFYQNYENKIKELRLLIQVKETNIQSLEAMISNKKWVVPTSNNVQIFQSYEQIRQNLQECWRINSRLLAENTVLKKQNEKVTQNLEKISKLIQSKCTFLEYRSLISQRTSKSVPKIKANIESLNLSQFQRKSKRKDLESTCQTKNLSKKNVDSTIYVTNYQTQNEIISKVVKMNQIIKKKNNQIRKLHELIDLLRKKIGAMSQEKCKLIQSNNLHQKQRLTLKKKVSEQEGMIQVLFNYLTQRNLHQEKLNFDDLSTSQEAKLKRKLKKNQNRPEVTKIQKQRWVSMKNTIEERLAHPKLTKNKKRGFSCVLDYIPIKSIEKQAIHPKQDQQQFSICLQDLKMSVDIEFVSGKNLKNREGKLKSFGEFQGGLFEDIDLVF